MLVTTEVDAAVAATVVAMAVWLVAALVPRRAGPQGEPPRVGAAIPFIGHGIWLKVDPHRFIRYCLRRCGPVFGLSLSGTEFVVVADADLIKEMFKHDAELTSADALVRLLGAKHTLGEERPFHPYHGIACRLQMNPRLPMFSPILARTIPEELMRRLPSETTVVANVVDFAENIIAACSSRSFFGSIVADLPQVRDTFRKLHSEMDAITMIYTMFGDWAAKFAARQFEFARHERTLEDILLPIVHERIRLYGHELVTTVVHRNAEDDDAVHHGDNADTNGQTESYRPRDFLQFLIDTPNDHDGAPLNDREIISSMAWAILGSMSTTRNGLVHLLYDIASFPDVQAKLRQEQREAIAKHGEELHHAALSNFPYLEMVMRESFRFSFATPVGAFRYTVKSDLSLSCGVTIPQNTMCTISPYAVHMDPRFFPDAHVFRPERYMDKGAHLMSNGWANKYMLAFGGGTHACPGRFFATHEIKCIVSILLRSYELTLPPGRTGRIQYQFGSVFEMFPTREKTPILFRRQSL